MVYTAIIQARMRSTRLPGKVLLPLENIPLLEHVVERLLKVKNISEVVVATSILEEDNPIANYLDKKGLKYFRGSQENVLKRYYDALHKYPCDAVIRATSDNPLLEPSIVSELLEYFERGDFNYCNCTGYPLGLTAEVFKASALKEAYNNATEPYEFEHVTPYMRFKMDNISYLKSSEELSSYRFTVDTPEDYAFLTYIFHNIYRKNKAYTYKEIIEYLKVNPDLLEINSNVHQKKLGE